MNILGPCSPLVATEHGVGFWDAEHRELRMVSCVLVTPKPVCFGTVSVEEARNFFNSRAAKSAFLQNYYATPGNTGD